MSRREFVPLLGGAAAASPGSCFSNTASAENSWSCSGTSQPARPIERALMGFAQIPNGPWFYRAFVAADGLLSPIGQIASTFTGVRPASTAGEACDNS